MTAPKPLSHSGFKNWPHFACHQCNLHKAALHCLRNFEFLHEICVIPESFLRSHLLMTRPAMVGRCWSLMRIALRSSFVHLEASLCQGEVRTNTSCCLVARVPFHPQSTIVARWRSIVILGDRRQYGCVTNTSGCLVARVPFHPQSTIVARWRSIVILDDRRQYGCVGDRHAERVQTRALPLEDDDQWPQWVLKFEAWSEVVGWGRQLDAASQSAHPILNTTLEQEVQTIPNNCTQSSWRNFDGKALGIVQVVGKGEGLEAWRQLKLEYVGKTGNRQAALLRGILNPRAGWEADARDGRSVVESLNSWERPSASIGVNISDGILAATVLEHSPENCQNILEQAPSNVRASYSAMRGWLREYAKTLRRYDGTSGFSSQQTQCTGLVPMEVDQTRAVSGFYSGKSSAGQGQGY